LSLAFTLDTPIALHVGKKAGAEALTDDLASGKAESNALPAIQPSSCIIEQRN
jgi:hypothetical protein